MKKRRLKKKFRILSVAIFSVLIVSLGLVFIVFHNEKQKEINQKDEQKEVYDNPLSGLRELYQNPDIIAELDIPSIELKEFILKGSDNDYYLNHDIQKNKTIIGAIFMDYRISDVDNAQQINIYGHNSDTDSIPFGKLVNYQEEDFFKKNLDITLKTDKNAYSYKIFAVSLVPKDSDEHMIVSYKENDFANHVNKMRSNSLFDTGEKISKNDNILVLQTCLFHPEQFLLIFAKKYKN